MVRFDNYETANQVNFASAPFRITRFGPEPVPQGRGVKRKRVDEDYQPTAGDAEEDEDDEQKYDSDGDVQM